LKTGSRFFQTRGEKKMKKTIEVNGQTMQFEATATTDHLMESIFGIRMTHALNAGENDKFPELVRKLAFVLNKRAELGSWRKVNELTNEDFLDWCDSIDSYAIEDEKVAKELLILYANNKETKVSPKNAASPQAGY